MGLNQIGDMGATALSKGIAVGFFGFIFETAVISLLLMASLESLAYCKLVFQDNSAIRILDLSSNRIGDVGATALSKGIAVSFVHQLFCCRDFITFFVWLRRIIRRCRSCFWLETRSEMREQQR